MQPVPGSALGPGAVTQETSLALPPRPRCPRPPCGHGGHLGGSRTGTTATRVRNPAGTRQAAGGTDRLGAQRISCSVTDRTPLTSGVSPPAPPIPCWTPRLT